MKSNYSFLVKLLIVQCLAISCASQGYDFFYFVQQAHIVIQRKVAAIQQQENQQQILASTASGPIMTMDHIPLTNCDPNNAFDLSLISDLTSQLQVSWPSLSCPSSDDTSFWTHEWDKHGTCSESVLDEHAYFQAALNLKSQASTLQFLESAGIQPDGGFHSLTSVKNAIQGGLGHEPVRIMCPR